MIFFEGMPIINSHIYHFIYFSFRTANAHIDSLGEVDVIVDAEVGFFRL